MNDATNETKHKCGKCDGRGRLSWTSLANGVCFQCDGAGVMLVTSEETEARRVPRADAIANIAKWLADFAACDIASWHHESGDRNGRGCVVVIARDIAYAPEDVAARGLAAVMKALHRANNAPDSDAASAQHYLAAYVREYTAQFVAGSIKIVRRVRKVA